MNSKAEQEEEFSEWVVIQTSPTRSISEASSPLSSPISQPSQGRDDDEDSIVPVVVEEEEDESFSNVNQSLPWRVIESAKKRLKDSRIFERAPCNYLSSTRVFWSLTLVCGFSLVSSLVYMKVVRWWRRLQEEKLRFVLLQLREKDQKIKELILEIGRLNESILSRRRVQVVRIV